MLYIFFLFILNHQWIYYLFKVLFAIIKKICKSSKNNLLKITVETGNEAVDEYFKGNITLINNLLMSLAEE